MVRLCIRSSEGDELGRIFRWVIWETRNGNWSIKYYEVEPFSSPKTWVLAHLPSVVTDGVTAFRTKKAAINEVVKQLEGRVEALNSYIKEWKRELNDN